MGQKVNAISFRVGINRSWFSKWFDQNEYLHLIHEDILIRTYLYSILKRMDFLVGDCHIKRSIGHVFITISVFNDQKRKSSSSIIDTSLIEDLFKKWTKNQIHLSIIKELNYTESASLLAEYISKQLEKRSSSKEVLKKAIQQIKLNSKIKGVRLNCSGRLDGSEIARTEWVKEGQVPLHTLKEHIDYAVATANTIYGVCGVKVWVCYK